jgi:hypothetical protein
VIALLRQRSQVLEPPCLPTAGNQGEVRLGEVFVFEGGEATRHSLDHQLPATGHWRSKVSAQ